MVITVAYGPCDPGSIPPRIEILVTDIKVLHIVTDIKVLHIVTDTKVLHIVTDIKVVHSCIQ